MRILAALALAVAFFVACKQETDSLPYTAGGGGGAVGGTGSGGSGSNHLDAPVVGGSVDAAISGRVCLTTDARQLFTCASSGAGGLSVSLGNAFASTNADGTFVLYAPAQSDLVWNVSGSAIMTSLMPYGPGAVIPALSIDTYTNLTGGNGVLTSPGQGAVFVQIMQAGAPLVMATVKTSPPPVASVFYDSGNANVWTTTYTGTYGVSWVPELTTGTVTITVTPPSSGSGSGSATPTVLTAPVGDEQLTFIVVDA